MYHRNHIYTIYYYMYRRNKWYGVDIIILHLSIFWILYYIPKVPSISHRYNKNLFYHHNSNEYYIEHSQVNFIYLNIYVSS